MISSVLNRNVLIEGAIGIGAITALTGDVSAVGPGSVPATLSTVNSNVGTFGDASHVGQFTVDGKGRITAASSVLIPAYVPPTYTQGSVLFAGVGGAPTQDNANFFWDDSNNRLGIGNAAPSETLHVTGNVRISSLTSGRVPFSTTGGVLTDNAAMTFTATAGLEGLVISTNGQALDSTTDSAQIHIGGDFNSGTSTGNANLIADSYGNVSTFTFRRAEGTQASKTAIGNAAAFLNFRGQGYDGSDFANGGIFRFVANGAWTGSNHGADFIILLTANASVAAPTEVIRVRNNVSGTVGINFNAPSAALEVRGTPVDIGYLIKARPTGTGSAYLLMSANGASNQAGFSYVQLSNNFEWRNAVIGNDGNDLRWAGGTGGTDVKMYLTQNGNLILNDSNIDPATGTKCLVLGDGTAPATPDSNSCFVYGNDVSGTVNVFVMNEASEINQISGDIKIASGKYFYTQAAAFMIRGATSYTDGAGALTGTLTNSPKTGNPTKWIAIDDNGTTRHIPAW